MQLPDKYYNALLIKDNLSKLLFHLSVPSDQYADKLFR